MSLPIEYYAIVIIILAYIIRGITGFGSGLIAIPLLALFLPLTFVVPFVLLLDFSASMAASSFDFKRVKWDELIWLIPFSIIGVIVGSQLLTNLPINPTLIALAIFIFIFAIRIIFDIHGNKIISKFWAIPTALIGGTIGALFGTGGPPYVVYLTHRIPDKTEFRASLSTMFFIDALGRITVFFIAGILLSQTVWYHTAAALPLMLGSLYLGSHIHIGISQKNMMFLVGLLLLGSSLSLLIKVYV